VEFDTTQELDSDHRILTAIVKLSLRRTKMATGHAVRLKWQEVMEDATLQNKFATAVTGQISVRSQEGTPDDSFPTLNSLVPYQAQGLICERRTKTATGARAFGVVAPKVWLKVRLT